MVPPPLPKDVVETEILTRLPVEPLLRFRCVCKVWNTLISDPAFIKSHLQCTSQNPNNDNLITRDYLDIDICLLSLSNHNKTKLSDIPYPEQAKYLFGSINGLICHSFDDQCKFVLWNPAIRQAKTINGPVIETRLSTRTFYYLIGFCWDSVQNDYKIVFSSNHKGPLVTSYVYSCNSDSWSLLPDCSIFLGCFWRLSVIVDGVPYWTCSTTVCPEKRKIVFRVIKFEVRSNEFRLLPEFDRALVGQIGFLLVNVKDCISALVYEPWSSNCLVDVYCLDERCGVWSKMYSVGLIIGVCVSWISHWCKYSGKIFFTDARSKGMSYDPKILFTDPRNNAMCYNPKTNKVEGLVSRLMYSFTYKASLVFLKGMKSLHRAKPVIGKAT